MPVMRHDCGVRQVVVGRPAVQHQRLADLVQLRISCVWPRTARPVAARVHSEGFVVVPEEGVAPTGESCGNKGKAEYAWPVRHNGRQPFSASAHRHRPGGPRGLRQPIPTRRSRPHSATPPPAAARSPRPNQNPPPVARRTYHRQASTPGWAFAREGAGDQHPRRPWTPLLARPVAAGGGARPATSPIHATPWAYLDSAVSPQRVAQGARQRHTCRRSGSGRAAATACRPASSRPSGAWRQLRPQRRKLLHPSTPGHAGHRRPARDWARGELLAHRGPGRHGGRRSWAPGPGAMGPHAVPLPSVFLRFAVDAGGDDAATSGAAVPDVAASTANFLAPRAGRAASPGAWRCGCRRLRLRALSWACARRATGPPRGVRAASTARPAAATDASILTPAGARRPAILVGPNFRRPAALRQFGELRPGRGPAGANRIDGGAGLSPGRATCSPCRAARSRHYGNCSTPAAWTPARLTALAGPTTRAGVRRYQQSLGLPTDGYRARAAAAAAGP